MDRDNLFSTHRAYFNTGATLDIDVRIKHLKRLATVIRKHESAILATLHQELHKSEIEGYTSEIGLVYSEIDFAVKNVRKWSKPEKRRTLPGLHPAKSSITHEPYGVVLILGPWNYPFQLIMTPLIGALAAGNAVVLKPSEFSPKTGKIIEHIVMEALPPDLVSVVQGGPDIAESLLSFPFDYIFFTGSSAVGRKVMKAASRHLTPVTLELGGKSPCVVFGDVPLKTAVQRIIWGKFMNAGQTCVAPDFCFVQRTIYEQFIEEAGRCITQFYGSAPAESPDFGRIINRKHFNRIVEYLADGKAVIGGDHNEKELFISPTLLVDVSLESTVMQDEIFGPILPILPFDDIGTVITELRNRPKPLALYIFSRDKKYQDLILPSISSGGVCINDTIAQIMGPHLPLGGVGESGMGSYRGKANYGCFSHQRSILKRYFILDSKQKYPPYRIALKNLKKLYTMFF